MIEVQEDTSQALQDSSWETVTAYGQASDELDPDIDEEVLDAAKDEAVVLSCHHVARRDYSVAIAVAAVVGCRQYLVSNQ